MVFQGLLTTILNSVLGSYVENLDPNQFKLGIWGGDVVLEGLVLKQSALDKLNLPVKTVYGHIGKLVLKIPWKSLYSSPVIASVERVFLLAVPIQDVTYDAEKEEMYAQQAKQAELERIETAKRQEKEKEKRAASASLYEKLATQIIKNVQVKIMDIHIRYEDRITTPTQPFALGLSLHYLSLHTTDENWKECVADEETKMIFKVLKMEGLAVYWNCHSKGFSVNTPTILLEEFKNSIVSANHVPKDYLYMLGPINLLIKLRLNPKPEEDGSNFTIPKVKLDLEMEQVAVGISKEQYANLIALLDAFDYMVRASQYRKYRPSVPVKGHAKEWWHFVYTAILEEEVRRNRRNWDWNHMLEHRERLRTYAKAYQAKLKSGGKVSADVQQTLDECERILDVFNIVLVRQKIEVEVERMGRLTETKQATGWFSGWFGGGAAKQDTLTTAALAQQFEEAMSPEEKEKLFRAIGYQENVAPTQYPPTFVERILNFHLKSLALEVRDDAYDNPRVLYAVLHDVTASVQQRPSASAINVVSGIKRFTIFGLKQGDFVPELVSSKNLTKESVLLDVLYETNPLDKSCDQRIHVTSLPLQIVYDANTINKVLDVFQTPPSAGISQLQAAAELRLTEFKEMSATGLQYAIDKHAELDLKVNLSASYVLIPEGGVHRGSENVIVLNLGSLSMSSIPRDTTQMFRVSELFHMGTTEEDVLKIMSSQSYDKFIVELKEIQILSAFAGEDWQKALASKQATVMHFLEPTTLTVQLEKCLITDDPRLPKLKISGSLPIVRLNVEDQRFLDILGLITSIPLPDGGEPEMRQPLDSSSRTSSVSVLSRFADMTAEMKKKKVISPTKTKEKEPDLVQGIEKHLTFVMGELQLIFYRRSAAESEKMLDFGVVRVEMEMVQQTYDLTSTLRIGGLKLLYYDIAQEVKMIETPMTAGEEAYMFVVKYVNVDKKSPEFHSKHGSVVQLIVVDFTSLTLLLHQECLVELTDFQSELQGRIQEIMPKAPEPPPSTIGKMKFLETIAEEGSEPVKKVQRPVAKKHHRTVTESIDLKVKASMHQINITVTTRKNILAKFSLEDLTAGVIVKKSYTAIDGSLKDIIIIDPSVKTAHPKILSIVGDEAMSFQVVMYNLTEDSKEDSIDMSIKAQMACIRVVFLNRFVSTILAFLGSFQKAQQVVLDAAAEAAVAATANVKDVYSKATRMQLGIDIKAPLIVVPVYSKSLDAILLDLGNLTINNKFDSLMVYSKEGYKVVIDEMKLDLQNLKLSRVKLDESGEVINECVLLEPISFKLVVRRNLSTSWYKQVPDIDMSGRLKTIKLKMSQEDYRMSLRITTGNLAERPEELLPAVVAPPVSKLEWEETEAQDVTEEVEDTAEVHSPERSPSELESAEAVTTFLKFTFTMDSLEIDLFTGGSKKLQSKTSPAHRPENGLARFSLLVLSLKGHMYSDGTLSTSMKLVDCLLDDTRVGRSSKLKRLLERKPDTSGSDVAPATASNLASDDHFRSMIDVTFQQKASDMFADVRIYGFNLLLSPDYMMKLGEFFSIGAEEGEGDGDHVQPGVKPPSKVATKAASKAASKAVTKATSKARSDLSHATVKSGVSKASSRKTATKQPEGMMTINLRVEKPDIILVENMDDENSDAVVLNNEIIFKLRMSGNHQVMSGTIKDLQLYTCCYSKREETVNQILRPCSISLAGSTPLNEGLHLDVCVTDIRIRVSPAAIELMGKIQAAMAIQEVEEEGETVEVDYSTIWQPREYEELEFWFLNTEEAEEATSLLTDVGQPEPLTEICMISVPSIVITIEAGVGSQTLPMLLLEVGFQGAVHNWSSQLYVDSGLHMQMSYYNSVLALWEPLLEPVETITDGRSLHTPWELRAEVQMNKADEQSSTPIATGEEVEELQMQPPAMTIDISSKDNMELTMTKSCLDVLTNLGKAFQTAYKHSSARVGPTAPFIVENDTGLTIALLLEEGPFQIQEKEDEHASYSRVTLQYGAKTGLCLEEGYDNLTLSKSATSLERVRERYLKVEVIERKCILEIPVTRADKRFFSLQHRGDGNDVWGLVSHVQVKDGGTIITLRGIIQVHNHFSVPIDVYYMTKRGNEVECIGTVAPKEQINLPLYSIYTPTNELFFSVEGYTVSVVPFVWKDLQNLLATTKMLQCEPKDRRKKEPFFMKIIGELEQVYFENTTRHTMSSTCYNIHLRPAVVVKNYLPFNIICCQSGTAIEKTVKAGERVQLPSAEPGSSSIVIRIPEYLEKEWSCKHEIQANLPEFSVWTFESYDSPQKVSIDLGMHIATRDGSIVMSLYCPFWMLNKTGLMLSYRKSRRTERIEASGSPVKQSDDTVNVLYHPEDFKGPVLFSFKAKSFFGKKKASIKIEDGEWSEKFSLDVAGNSGVVDCKFDGMVYKVGVHIQLTYSTLTKQVTFTPYYVLINNSKYAIECQEASRPADPWFKVEPGECSALWPRDPKDKNLRARICGTYETTAAFSYDNVYTMLLHLENKYGGLNVDVQMTEGGVYVGFRSYEPGLAPALVINHTPVTINFTEKGTENDWKLEPKHCRMFTWADPLGSRELIWPISKKKEIADDLRKDGIGEFSPEPGTNYYWVSFLDGMQRVLLFTADPTVAQDAQSAGELEAFQQEINVSIYGVGLSLVNNTNHTEVLYIGIASSGIIWEVRKHNHKRFKPVSIKDNQLIEEAYQKYSKELEIGRAPPSRVQIDPKLEVDFETQEMLKPHKRHLRRVFQTGVWAQMRTSAHQMQLHAKVNRLQIDNQMYDCVFPVVLAPVPPPKSVAADSALKPFAELSIVRRLMEHSPVQQYKYFKILIQEFHVKIDIGFVNALMEMFAAEEISEQEEARQFEEDMELVKKPLLVHVALQSSQEQKNFYDLLHFSPLKIHLSFSLSGGQNLKSSQETPRFLSVLLQSLGVTLTDIQDVVFKLAYFDRQYTFLTQNQLMYEVKMHYLGQSLKQLYVLVLGLDVLGNPYGLVVGFTQGVEDLFYEPFQGAIQGPGEFAEGLVLGVRSLFGHTVGGAAGAVSRITGAMGKGIAALTFDKDYQRRRRENLAQRPANVQMGLARSGKGLVMGVVDGVSGVFLKPISGAREEGVEGFFKGVGKGMVGLVTRPTAGVIDFASGSLDAVKRATDTSDEVTRLRSPRFFQQDGLVRPYVRKDAEGNKLLQELDKSRYARTDVYVYHTFTVPSAKEVLLITDKRVMYIIHNDIFGSWQVEWDHTWDSMSEPPTVVDKGIYIHTGESRKKVLGLFGSSEKTGKIVLVKDNAEKEWLVQKMKELMGNR